MQRLKDEFLDKLEEYVPLEDLSILEIGCGDGSRSAQIAQRCRRLTAIEPKRDQVQLAISRHIPNAHFRVGSAEKLNARDHIFDVIIFTLSLHHIPRPQIMIALNEALRVVRRDGYIVILEPAEEGSYFEAEIQFDANDGDERQQKRAAYEVLISHPGLLPIVELNDETYFQFESTDDFMHSLQPRKNLAEIENFLKKHQLILRATRRINIFQAKT